MYNTSSSYCTASWNPPPAASSYGNGSEGRQDALANRTSQCANSELELDVSLRPLANNVVKYHGKAPWRQCRLAAFSSYQCTARALAISAASGGSWLLASGFWLLLVLLGSEATMPTAQTLDDGAASVVAPEPEPERDETLVRIMI